jgi:hypothetical protein
MGARMVRSRLLVPVLAAAALAACNSGGVISNPTPVPVTVATTTPSPTPTGQTNSVTLAATGGTLSFGPYANAAGTTVSLASTWGANNQTAATLAGSFAAGSSDLTPPNASWTAYNLAGTVVIYVQFTALPATTFTQSPALTFTTSKAVTGSSCSLPQFSNGAWTAGLTGGVLSNGNTTITFAAQTPAGGVKIGNAGTTPPNVVYLALVCQ